MSLLQRHHLQISGVCGTERPSWCQHIDGVASMAEIQAGLSRVAHLHVPVSSLPQQCYHMAVVEMLRTSEGWGLFCLVLLEWYMGQVKGA